MPRPRRFRRIGFQPNITYFKPTGIGMFELEETILTFEEFEAVRLKDFEGLEQEKAAKKMKISQPTFNRLLKEARKKIADAIVNGKAIRIQGGVYKMVIPRRAGRGLRAGIGAGRGRGRMGGFAAGPGGYCVCPKCGTKAVHQIGIPCYQQKCPKCGSPMTRA